MTKKTEHLPVAFEFYNPSTGHAIVAYDENTHVGKLTAEKGYQKIPLYKFSQQLADEIEARLREKNGGAA